MARRWVAVIGLLAVMMGLLVATAQAGGWATVTLGKMIEEPRAGEMIDVGFLVKQHGETPIHRVGGNGPAVEAVFTALHEESGERLQVKATPAKEVGHFVAQVSFPKAGMWLAEIIPAPFAGTKLNPINVLTATGERVSTSAADEASIAQSAPATVTASPGSDGRTRDVVITIGLLTVALALTGVAAFGWRGRLTRG